MATAKLEVKKELEKCTGVTRASEETEQSYLGRIMRKIAALDEDEWDKLSDGAQAWYNQAVEDANKKRPIEGFGEEETAPKARTSRAQPASDEPEGPADPAVGDTVMVTLNDGEKVKGELLEFDEKNVVLMVDGEEEPYRRSKIKDIKVTKSTGGSKATAPAKAKDPAVGDEVEAVHNDTGEIKYKGKLTEIDDKNAVIEVDGEEEVARLTKFTIRVVGAAAPAKDEKKSTRAQPASDDKKSSAKDTKGDDKKEAPKRGTETYRAREIVIENPEADKAAAFKLVCDEFGSDEAVKKVTFDMIYADTHKTLEILRSKKLLKG